MTRPRKPPPDEGLLALQRQLDESKAAFQALVSGQVDAVTHPSGTLLLKEAQDSLRHSEQNFRALIERLPDQVWVHRAGRIVYVNPVVTQSLGYPVAELVGRELLDFVVPEDRALVEARIREDGAPQGRYEARLRRRNGLPVVLEISAQEVLFDGAPATLVVAHDLTRRKELEAHVLVSERMASVGMLAAGVAHEINNPLSYVLANVRFVAEELAVSSGVVRASAWADALREAEQGAERVRGIVRDLKTFSRSDGPQHGSVDLHRMLDSAGNMAGSEIRHSARFVKDYARSPLMVEGSESRLSQVFLNLLVNAAQAIPEGAVDRNEIRVVTHAEPDGRVLVEVRDTGPGMSAEVRGHLFTPFFTTKPRGIGTGLGLSICHKIITEHLGEISVESEVGKGTAFKVWLPAAREAPASKPVPATVSAPRRGRVLIVDDEPMVGNAVRRMVGQQHDAVVVDGGKSALRLLTTDSNFDVVFCDLMMPELSGPQLYDALALTHPELAQRMVFLSGGAFTEAARTFLERVPNLRMDKPFDRGQLLSVIAQALSKP